MDTQYILFDLDGTLTDPKVGITKSVDYALQSFGIKTDNLDDLICFIGPPLKNSFMDFYGFSEAMAETAIEKYREYFVPYGIFENSVYDNAEDLLKELRECGKKIILATSKPQEFAERILEHFGITKYFDAICGADLAGARSEKWDIIAYAINKCKIENTSDAIMIGDRKHDVCGAQKNNMDCIGVLYGYGTREELQEAGATYIAQSMGELKKILLG